MKKLRLLVLSLAAVTMASCGANSSSTSSAASSSEAATSSTATTSETKTSSEEASSSTEDSSEEGTSAEDSSEEESSSKGGHHHSSSSEEESSSAEESSEASSSEESSEEESSSEESSKESSEASSESSSEESSEESSSSEESTSEEESSSSEESSSVETTLGDDFCSTTDGSMTIVDNVYTLLSSGTYTVTGTKEAQIVVNAGDEDSIEIDLNGANISYGENSPIYIENADGVDISAKSGTTNSVTDLRDLESTEDDTQGNGAIYSKCDLKLKGSGELTVTGTYNNGVHSTKDLTVQKQTLTVTAPNNALKGNDSVEIKSGTLTVISTGGDGIKTSDSDISSSGNQRGTVTILDGTVNIYAACDAIDASYNVDIQGGTVNMKTNSYSSYTGDIVESSTETMYLRTTSYSSSYRYAVYFYDDDGNYSWSDASYLTSMSSGGGRNSSTYYYYDLDRPSGYGNFKIYAFASSTSENSTTSYKACSSGSTINTNYDTVTFSLSGSTISTSGWTTYSAQSSGGWGPGGGESSSTSESSDVSAKGLKAANEIYVSGGTIDIEAADDGIHANYGDTLENEETGLGNVHISGGTITVVSKDDGIHADYNLNISGGTITVSESYEGLEGNQIAISGGESYVYASDDAVNAGSSGPCYTPNINVTGGYLCASVPTSGDTDCIDSNGYYTQTAGVVIAGGPNSENMAAIDADYTVSVKGGTLAVFGYGNVSYSGVTKSSKSGTYSGGYAYTLTFANGTVTTGKLYSGASFSGCTAYSDYGSLSSVAKAS